MPTKILIGKVRQAVLFLWVDPFFHHHVVMVCMVKHKACLEKESKDHLQEIFNNCRAKTVTLSLHWDILVLAI